MRALVPLDRYARKQPLSGGKVHTALDQNYHVLAVSTYCSTAWLGVVSPPMNSHMPSMTLLPTTAISADAPSSMTYTRDTMDGRGGEI
jgi:hypothetical protein